LQRDVIMHEAKEAKLALRGKNALGTIEYEVK
jgi:hypothetical protein